MIRSTAPKSVMQAITLIVPPHLGDRPSGPPHRLSGSSPPNPWKGCAEAPPRPSGEEKPPGSPADGLRALSGPPPLLLGIRRPLRETERVFGDHVQDRFDRLVELGVPAGHDRGRVVVDQDIRVGAVVLDDPLAVAAPEGVIGLLDRAVVDRQLPVEDPDQPALRGNADDLAQLAGSAGCAGREAAASPGGDPASPDWGGICAPPSSPPWQPCARGLCAPHQATRSTSPPSTGFRSSWSASHADPRPAAGPACMSKSSHFAPAQFFSIALQVWTREPAFQAD